MTADLPEAVFALWASRVESGEALDLEELLRAHPSIAVELRQLHDEWRLFAPLLERVVPGLIASSERRAAPVQSDADAVEPDPATRVLLDRLGVRVPNEGRYRFRGVVGHGGGGVVLKVWDTKLGRPLAMKVVLGRGATPTGDTPEVDGRTVTRFIDEARIASQLDHPGIVPVHEIGADESGRAYFTMKLVRGENLETVFAHVRARRDNWSATRAVGVILKVCEALAFAHERGVVHRDVKPANVMVGRLGEVYVMDWGLARVVAAVTGGSGVIESIRGAERSAKPGSAWLTMDGNAVGTPAYMAPEQARGEVGAVDARSDVYAVGAMLYELLTGFAPYMERDEHATAVDIVHAVIDGPPTPVEKLAPRAPVELVAICERAMARERHRRYANAAELTEDLRAYLEERVVVAHATGAWAETRKWIRRNKGLASACGAVFVVSVGFAIALSISSSQRVLASTRAELAAEEALASERKAVTREREALDSRARADMFATLFERTLSRADPYQGGNAKESISDVMDAVRQEIESGLVVQQPEMKASMQVAVARILNGQGRSAEALPLAESAFFTLCDGDSVEHPDRIEAEDVLAMTLYLLGRASDALPHHAAVLEMNQRRHPRGHVVIAKSLLNLSRCVHALGRKEEALELDRRALEMLETLQAGDSEEIAAAETNYGTALERLGRHAEAMAHLQTALEMARRIYPRDHPLVVACLNNVASTLSSLDRIDEALPLFVEALEMRRRISPGDHPDLVTNLTNVAFCFGRLGRHAEALTLYQDAAAMRRRVYAGDHVLTARSIYNVGYCLRAVDRVADALVQFEEALAMQKRAGPDDLEAEALYSNNIATALLSLDRPAEALPMCERALALAERLHEGDHLDVASCLNNLGFGLDFLGRVEESLARFESAARMYERLLPPAHPEVQISWTNVVRRQVKLGRFGAALLDAERLREILAQQLPEGDPRRAACEALIASVREQSELAAKAEGR